MKMTVYPQNTGAFNLQPLASNHVMFYGEKRAGKLLKQLPTLIINCFHGASQ